MLFFDGINTMMQKQNLPEYLFISVNEMRVKSGYKLKEVIVQVVAFDTVSDSNINFPCVFKKIVKKGSYIRLTNWTIDLKSVLIVVTDFQNLGGEGYAVQGGKLWDTEKLKYMNNSNLVSNNFVVLHIPTPLIQKVEYPKKEATKPPNEPIRHIEKPPNEPIRHIEQTINVQSPRKQKLTNKQTYEMPSS